MAATPPRQWTFRWVKLQVLARLSSLAPPSSTSDACAHTRPFHFLFHKTACGATCGMHSDRIPCLLLQNPDSPLVIMHQRQGGTHLSLRAHVS